MIYKSRKSLQLTLSRLRGCHLFHGDGPEPGSLIFLLSSDLSHVSFLHLVLRRKGIHILREIAFGQSSVPNPSTSKAIWGFQRQSTKDALDIWHAPMPPEVH